MSLIHIDSSNKQKRRLQITPLVFSIFQKLPIFVYNQAKLIKRKGLFNQSSIQQLYIGICNILQYLFLAPTRSPRNANVRLFVRSMKTCLELTIFIIWVQILHDDFMMTS